MTDQKDVTHLAFDPPDDKIYVCSANASGKLTTELGIVTCPECLEKYNRIKKRFKRNRHDD